jgi:hypothetical protein
MYWLKDLDSFSISKLFSSGLFQTAYFSWTAQNLERQKFETSSAELVGVVALYATLEHRLICGWSDIDSYAAPLMCQTAQT